MKLKNMSLVGRQIEYLTIFQDDIPEAQIQAFMLTYLMSWYYLAAIDINVKFWF